MWYDRKLNTKDPILYTSFNLALLSSNKMKAGVQLLQTEVDTKSTLQTTAQHEIVNLQSFMLEFRQYFGDHLSKVCFNSKDFSVTNYLENFDANWRVKLGFHSDLDYFLGKLFIQ